jgi:LuxR family transcriptional regulator, maltose regulon positive regulatory protein
VATKLLIPPTPQHLIQRERLLDRLDGGVRERLILLSAPAGTGKTALLSSWVKARELPGPACWLSLDTDHNDASRLIADLLSALRSSGAIRRGSVLDRLTPPTGARTDHFMPVLVNGLVQLRSPVVLLLDDAHELTSPQATATIDFLVRHAPEQCRLVLAGRADPPLPIERLRMSEEITELRIRDLAFDRSETADLCRRLDLALTDRDLDALWERSEGWAAALRLAAVSLHGHPQPDRFLADFAGTDRAVADYLLTEVLTRLPADQREFMLRTCLVDTINPALADSLTGLEGRGTSTLAALEHSGVPVQPIVDADGHHCDSYRYHPLLRELLLLHLRHAHPEEVSFLHRRAAHWYSEHGQTLAAIRHALTGEDWEQAGSLVAHNWLDLFLSGRSAAMRGLIAQLPADVIATDPQLAVAYAGSRLQDGDVQEAERQIAVARSARGEIPEHMRERHELTLAAVALFSARLRVHLGDAERHARKLTRLVRASSDHRWIALRSFALSSLGAVRLWTGDPEAAAPVLHDALALATEGGYEQIALDCLGELALIHLLRGELNRAEELSSAATRLAVQQGWTDGPWVAAAYLAAGADAYQRGEFERAEGLLSQAASAADTAEAPVGVAVGLLQALSLATAGSSSAGRGALKLLAIRAAMDESDDIPEALDVALDVAEVRVLMAAGEVEQARASLAAARKRAPERPELLVRRASIELRDNQPGLAAASLEQVLGPAAESGEQVHPATLVEAWLLQALVEQSNGDQQVAGASLDRALELAEQEPFRDAFLLNGPAVRELLEHQAQRGTAHPALLEMLLDGVGQPQSGKLELDEPLTQRELRILRYLPTMLSNAEIGAEIFVSLNTVKTHLRSIYRKLHASGRADAVDRARELGLLPSGIKRPRVVSRA